MDRRGFLGALGGIVAGGAAYSKTPGGLLIEQPAFVHEDVDVAASFTAVPRDLSFTHDIVQDTNEMLGGFQDPDSSRIVEMNSSLDLSFDVFDIDRAKLAELFSGSTLSTRYEVTITRKN